MLRKVLKATTAVLIIGVLGFVVFTGDDTSTKARPGAAQEEKGRNHVATTNEPNTGDEPPTSGDHDAQPLPRQAFDQEVPDARAIHNLEHGYIYISYRPDLPAEQVEKIKGLFFAPFTREKFDPNKVIMAPRAENGSLIVLSSWTRSLKLDVFDEEKMVEFYLKNVSKSPEPGAS